MNKFLAVSLLVALVSIFETKAAPNPQPMDLAKIPQILAGLVASGKEIPKEIIKQLKNIAKAGPEAIKKLIGQIKKLAGGGKGPDLGALLSALS